MLPRVPLTVSGGGYVITMSGIVLLVMMCSLTRYAYIKKTGLQAPRKDRLKLAAKINGPLSLVAISIAAYSGSVVPGFLYALTLPVLWFATPYLLFGICVAGLAVSIGATVAILDTATNRRFSLTSKFLKTLISIGKELRADSSDA